MKTKFLTVFVLATLLPLSGALAQTVATAPASPAPNQTIYSPRLPSATELTNAAAAQGLSIEKIDQTAAQVTVTYKTSGGQTNVVSYQLLPVAGASASTPVAVPTPAPMVVESAPRVVYYERPYDYYPAYSYSPSYWYPPVSLSLGFGFRGGSFRGGFHHWR